MKVHVEHVPEQPKAQKFPVLLINESTGLVILANSATVGYVMIPALTVNGWVGQQVNPSDGLMVPLRGPMTLSNS